MKVLARRKKVVSFKVFYALAERFFYGLIIAFYLAFLTDQSLIIQVVYVMVFSVFTVMMDWLTSKSKQLNEVVIENNRLKLLDVDIDLLNVKEILYFQTKRFEHNVRFRYLNATYQDFELSGPDLIEDLRLYQFLVENNLPVKMLDSDERVS